MVIKKYISATEEEAIKLAKDELGKDAVVMNVKKTVPRGIFKLFQKPSVEITAAVDENPAEQDAPDFSKLQAAIKKQEQREMKKNQAGSDPLLASDQFEASRKKEEQTKKAEQEDIEAKLSSLQALLEKQMAQNKEDKKAPVVEDKKETTKEKSSEPGDKIEAYFDAIREKMLDNEVLPEYVDEIIDAVDSGKRKDQTLDSVLAGVYQKIILKIGQPHLIDIRTKSTKYIFFVGPTGVGKTTTIAKIASTLRLTKKTKVALITADTYRIAAVSQLETYANILGIPLEVIYAPEEMEQVMDKLKDFDLVLVDTAGRSHHNKEQMDDIKSLLDYVPEANREVYLVLSAATKYRDLVKITKIYNEITKFFLVFTKLDETDTIGNIFNIRMLTGASLSYATWGQNVPDDIGKIDAQKIAKQLLGGNS